MYVYIYMYMCTHIYVYIYVFFGSVYKFWHTCQCCHIQIQTRPKIECECLQHNLKRQKVLQKLPMLKVLLLHGGTPNIIYLKTYSFVSTISQFPWG